MSLEEWWVMWAESVLSFSFDCEAEMWYQAACILAASRGPA
mgnify:CR=1 FL=1